MNLDYEKTIWAKNNLLIGFDEVGYGSAAKDMHVAGVVFGKDFDIPTTLKKVDDSKKLSEETRFELEVEIKKYALYYKILTFTPDQIDSGNIYWARYTLAESILDDLYLKYQNISSVIDGNLVTKSKLPIEQTCCVKGDSKVFSIACAAILAKTAKDREMIELDKIYPNYNFKSNKGYLTKDHIEAIGKYGALDLVHRKSFLKKYI